MHLPYSLESDRAKRAHGGVKNEKFAEIVPIYAGLERSELASDSAKLTQFIAAVSDAFLRSRPWFVPESQGPASPSLVWRAALLLLVTSVAAFRRLCAR